MEENNHSLFEYSTFKIPYEDLNQKFRLGSKNIDRVGTYLCKSTIALKNELHSTDEVISPEKVCKLFTDVEKRVQEFRQTIKRSINDQRELLTTIKRRVEYLNEEDKPSDSVLDKWHRKRSRTNRLTIIYLLRCGRIETAKKFASKTKLEHMIDVDTFDQACKIEAALYKQDTEPCLKWIMDHRSKLKRIMCNLEQLVRVQDVVELLKKGERMEAFAYARKFLAVKQDENRTEDVLRVHGLLATNIKTTHKLYRKLLDEDRWSSLGKSFREAFWDLYSLPYQSAFSTTLQYGISAHKTLVCSPGGNENCVACQPIIYELGDGLPRAATGQSRLYCAYSGEELNEDNPPYMLPSGHVYGEKALDRIETSGGSMRCIKSDEPFRRIDCVRLYIM